MTEEQRAAEFAAGRPVSALDDWCRSFPGFNCYYLSRHQPSSAFTLLVKALR